MSGPPTVRAFAARRQHGLGLVEVLAALIVISLGALGVTGLQLSGIKHSTGGLNRSKALLLAENMAVRMRINEPGVAARAYAKIGENFDTSTWGESCRTRPVPYCQTSQVEGTVVAADSCDSAQLAEFDLWSVACGDWGSVDAAGGMLGEGVIDALPDGRLQVSCDAVSCTTYTITVSWNEGSASATEPGAVDARRVQMRLRP